jgi:hypothetical protein
MSQVVLSSVLGLVAVGLMGAGSALKRQRSAEA